jgi:hypothetical protein
MNEGGHQKGKDVNNRESTETAKTVWLLGIVLALLEKAQRRAVRELG